MASVFRESNGTALSSRMLTALAGFGGGRALTRGNSGPRSPKPALFIGAEWETDSSGGIPGLAFRRHGRHRVVAEEPVLGRTARPIDGRLPTRPSSMP